MEATALVSADPAEDIIAELTADDGLPRGAMRAAVENWEAALPSFLDMLERFVRDPAAHDGDADPLFFVVHLCGQMREQRAYRPLMKLLAMKPEHVERVLGDAVTATIDRVTASVFDGDPGPLRAVIEAKDADEFVRLRLFRALAFLTKEGRIPLEDTHSYLLRCYGELEPQGQSMVWVGWQEAIAYLGLVELRDLVRKAFASGMIGRHVMRFHHFEDDLESMINPPAAGRARFGTDYGYFGDAIAVLSRWHGFSEAARRVEPMGEARLEGRTSRGTSFSPFIGTSIGEPLVNPHRHVGRNDPCPCGSGKKHKKCCLS